MNKLNRLVLVLVFLSFIMLGFAFSSFSREGFDVKFRDISNSIWVKNFLENETFNLSEIDHINIEIHGEDINIISDTEKTYLNVSGFQFFLLNPQYYSLAVEGRELFIIIKEETLLSKVEMYLAIEKGYEGKVTINGEDSNIFMDGVEVKEINVFMEDKMIYLNKVIAENIEINNGSGNILVRETKANLNMISESGSIDVDSINEKGHYQIETETGAITVNLNSDYILEISTEEGSMEYQDTFDKVYEQTATRLNAIKGVGTLSIELKTKSGDIIVKEEN